MYAKICPMCKKEFDTSNAEKVYCSRKCSVKNRKKARKRGEKHAYGY